MKKKRGGRKKCKVYNLRRKRATEFVSQACADRGREIETSPALDERVGCAQTKTLPS